MRTLTKSRELKASKEQGLRRWAKRLGIYNGISLVFGIAVFTQTVGGRKFPLADPESRNKEALVSERRGAGKPNTLVAIGSAAAAIRLFQPLVF